MADSAIVAYVVPGLVKLEASITGVYWIGGDAAHAEGDNHYAQDTVVARLQTIADSMQTTVNGTTLYLQYNDASLPDGGTFSVPTPQIEEHSYSGGHLAHDTGLDLDIAFCYTAYQGDDGGELHRVRACSSTPSRLVDEDVLKRVACAQHGIAEIHNNSHYHIRFVGTSDDVCQE